jgi:DNA-binding transcriptional LysR family regulator
MNVPPVDSKLLVVFDALMSERSVTRAARRVGMSQPAVSSALARLRDVLKDELFLRVAGGVRPTPRALELALPVHDVLAQLQSVLRPAEFEVEKTQHTFNLAVSDHCAILLLPTLLERLRERAPGIQVRIRPKSDALVVHQLASGEIDLAIGVIQAALTPQLRHLTLFQETYVCVMRTLHPLADCALDFGRYMAAEHLVVTHAGEPTQLLDRELFKRGHERRIAMTINQSLLAPLVLERSDLLLTSYRQLVTALPAFADFRRAPLPIEVPALEVKLLWHSLFNSHPAHLWLQQQIQDICAERGLTAPAP